MLQHDLRADQAEVGHQRDQLEAERRQIAEQPLTGNDNPHGTSKGRERRRNRDSSARTPARIGLFCHHTETGSPNQPSKPMLTITQHAACTDGAARQPAGSQRPRPAEGGSTRRGMGELRSKDKWGRPLW